MASHIEPGRLARSGSRRVSQAKYTGSKETVRSQVSQLKQQLGEKQYKRIDAEHREKLIEHKTVQMAVEDLNRYYKALNAALMRFHETKMADINKSITELWNKTYKGSDIDGIAIKTEDEGQTASGARKQTYRVVMRKGDATLDMRGRCSAGQKVLASLVIRPTYHPVLTWHACLVWQVLASLVIRLALAETFCINCGILALDEPTTNLDRANIESLAGAINEIIKQRKQQANFQARPLPSHHSLPTPCLCHALPLVTRWPPPSPPPLTLSRDGLRPLRLPARGHYP